MEIVVTGVCVLSSAGETAFALCERSVLEKTITQQIDLCKYEKEVASINTGPRELYRIQKLLLIAFLKASHMAGLGMELTSPERVGIFLGNSYGIEEFKTEFFRLYKKSDPALTSPTLFPFTTANALASWLAIQTGAKGPSLTFVSGSTASAEAILAACDALVAGECDIAFVGGTSVIDNNLSDEFYSSGFRYESAGMLVLEKMNNVKLSKRKPIAILKDLHSTMFTQKQVEKIKHKQSVLSVNDKMHGNFNKDCAEIIYLGNNLGDTVFSCDRNKPVITTEERKVFFLSDVIGNVFDAAGVLGVALGVDLLNLPKDTKWRPFDSPQESILYSNIGSSGTAVMMLVNKA
ncbi:MAG: hypothetical protein KKD29_05425 [Candidatus Omnitrophica bacterium]|nr:hypothetical protein [Candidatus Omnitrophota bacterium]